MSLRRPLRKNQRRANVRQTDATVEPVSTDELKTHLRIAEDDDACEEEYLAGLITEARRWMEDETGIAFLSQTWTLSLDHWPAYHDAWWDGVRQMATTELYSQAPATPIILPRYPAISLDTVTVYDEAGVSTAVTIADVFDVDVASRPARVALKRGATWPTASRSLNAIELDYTAGWGTAVSDVPPSLRRAVLEMAAYMHTHRGDCTPEEGYTRSSAHSILRTYRVREI